MAPNPGMPTPKPSFMYILSNSGELINSHDLDINPHIDPLYNGKFQLIFENSSHYFSLELLDEYTLSLYLEDKLKNIDIMEKDVEINEASIVLIADSLQQYFPECQTS